MNSRFSSRKFQVTMFITLFSSLALSWGWLDGANYAVIASACITSYNFANAVGHWKGKEE